jgi:hypothetical protein
MKTISQSLMYRAICVEPGIADMFVVVLINGRRVSLNDAVEFPQLRVAAERLAMECRCHVKVLPLAPDEVLNFLNLRECTPTRTDPALRALDVKTCLETLYQCASADEVEDVLRRLETLQ